MEYLRVFLALSHMGQLCSSEQSSSSGQSHVSSCSDSESDCGFVVSSFVEEFPLFCAAGGSFLELFLRFFYFFLFLFRVNMKLLPSLSIIFCNILLSFCLKTFLALEMSDPVKSSIIIL